MNMLVKRFKSMADEMSPEAEAICGGVALVVIILLVTFICAAAESGALR